MIREPLRELLVNRRWKTRAMKIRSWRDNTVREVQHSELELVKANFADIPLRLFQILKLKPGDAAGEKPTALAAMWTARSGTHQPIWHRKRTVCATRGSI